MVLLVVATWDYARKEVAKELREQTHAMMNLSSRRSLKKKCANS